MNNRKMTARQTAILQFMQRHLVEHQCLPTIREIALAFGIRSPNGVFAHLQALVRHGALVRAANRRKGTYRLLGVAIRLETTAAPVLPIAPMSDGTLSRRDGATTWSPQGNSPNSFLNKELLLEKSCADACA